ncbi:MAG: hypothetical protein ACT4O1_02305 [Gemmatimonadota bacterium]
MVLFGNTGKNARLIGSALLIMTFVVGALAGAAVIRAVSANAHTVRGERVRIGGPAMRGGPRRLLLDEEFSKEIALTVEQRAQIKQILDRRDVEMKKLWAGFEPRLKDFGQQVHAEIENALTPEQQAKLEVALEQGRGQRRHRDCPSDSTKATQKENSR